MAFTSVATMASNRQRLQLSRALPTQRIPFIPYIPFVLVVVLIAAVVVVVVELYIDELFGIT